MSNHISRVTDARKLASVPPLRLFLPVILIFASLLAACGGQSGTPGTITLQLIQWTNAPAVTAVKQIIADFEKKNPNIKIVPTAAPTANQVYAQLQSTRLTANNVDIMAVQAFTNSPASWSPSAQKPTWQQWIEAGRLLDLTGQSFLNNYYPQALKDASTFNGKVYSVPTGAYGDGGLFYNKDIFAKYNLQIPTTFDELMHVCQVLKSNGVTPFAIGAKDGWPLNLAVFGLQSSLLDQQAVIQGLWTGKVKFTDPQMVEVLTRMQKIMQYTQDNFTGLDYNTAGSYFSSGKVAMVPDGTWQAPTFAQANPALKFGYFPTPGSDTASKNTQLAGKYDLAWVVNAKTSADKRDAALKWLAFFSQPENYAKYVNGVGILPVQSNVNLQDSFLKEIAPSVKNFKLAWDQLTVGKQSTGQYIGANPPDRKSVV